MPQTKQEQKTAIYVSIPWAVFVLAFPFISTYTLKARLGDQIPYWIALIHLALMVFLTNLVDLVVLDWLIISKITPKFVIIPGSDPQDYKDFSHHYHGHAKASILLLLLCVFLAGIVTFI